MSERETPGCPVCWLPVGAATECQGCGWVLRTGWRIGGRPDAATEFAARLATAGRRFDLLAVGRVALADPTVAERAEALVRHGPVVDEDRAWLRSQHPTVPAPDGGTEPVDVAARLAGRRSGSGGIHVVVVDEHGTRTHVFDRDGLRERARLVEHSWPALVDGLPDDPVERSMRLASGWDTDPRNGLDRLDLDSAPVGNLGVLVVGRWVLPERLAAAIQVARPDAELLRRAPTGPVRGTTAMTDGSLTAWRVRGGRRPVVLGGGRDGTVHAFGADLAPRPPVHLLGGSASAVDGDPDLMVLLAGGWNGEVGLYGPGGAQALPAHAGRVNGVSLADGMAATVGDDGHVGRSALRGAEAPEPLPSIVVGGLGCSAVAMSSTGALLAVGGSDGTLRLFDADGRPAGSGSTAAIVAVDVGPAGRWVVAGAADGTTGLFDVDRGTWVAWCGIANRDAVTAVAVDDVGGIATGHAGGAVLWWPPGSHDERRGVELGHHEGAVRGIGIILGIGDGTRNCPAVLSAGRQDGVVRLWPVRTT